MIRLLSAAVAGALTATVTIITWDWHRAPVSQEHDDMRKWERELAS